MAAETVIEEELQSSLGGGDEDAIFEEDDEFDVDMLVHNANATAANNQLQNGLLGQRSDGDELEDDELSEEDDEMADYPTHNGDDASEDGDGDEDEDGEGVGAVKIQPGLMDDDDENVVSGSDEDGSVASAEEDDESKDSTDAEVEVEWEPAAEEEEEPANPNRCVFCQQDEDNDPSEEFELYLACGVCGDNAHRQCARNAQALKPDDDADPWYCPDCVSNRLVPEAIPVGEEVLESSRRISRDRIAGDLLPSHRGAIKPDSHSVFNQLIAPEDPMDGSRLLRKRKTSSTEIEAEETTTIRTRNREKIDALNQANYLQPLESNDHVEDDPPSAATVTLTLPNGIIETSDAPKSLRISRSLRPKSSSSFQQSSAKITEKTTTKIKILIKVDPVELRHILSLPPKPKKKRRTPSAARSSTTASNFVPATYTQPFYSLHDKEVDEMKAKPYGGILQDKDADTTMTLPTTEHRRQFDEARQKAEEEWKARVAAAAEAAAASGIKKARKVSGPASQIEYIEFGQHQIDIWYAAPYPEEYSRNKALFICEFCLKYMESDIVAWRHKTKCPWKHPPGDEIYRDGKIMIFEVDGRKNPLYCQNLCLLAKLFLGSKTLYYDVEPFLFYVMTEYDEFGCHFVGYFSKEKRPSSLNNVSCILVLPIHQRKGYGHLLIDFSYLLTRVERKTGSPEKPLSDMGLVSYRNYWRLVLCYYLKDFRAGDRIPSVKKISNDMGLTPDDVISALDALGALIRDPTTGTYAMKLKTDYYREVIRQHEVKGYAKLNPKGLVWTPYIMGRGNAATFDHGPPLNTIAPRDEEDHMSSRMGSQQIGKRDFEMFNGDTTEVTESLGKLTTESGALIKRDSIEGDDTNRTSMNGIPEKLSYYEAAASIPATHFEVFPPAAGGRSRPTPRPSSSRPAPSRSKSSASSSSRPKARRPPSSSSRRSTSSRPRSSARRKSGGTGRGPGRWPKGTKKSDFGNADSGPGLPPRLLKQRSKLGNEVLLGENEQEDDDGEPDYEERDESAEEDEDAIVYETPVMRTRRDRDLGRGKGLGKPILDGKGKGMGMGMGKGKGPILNGDGDEDEDDEMDDILPISGDLSENEIELDEDDA